MNSILNYRKTLMGIATFWILLLHYYDQLYMEIHLPFITQLASIGYVGVEIFLFLSGAGLYCSLTHNPNIKCFYIKRVVRVLIPWLAISMPYWILKTIIVDGDNLGIFLINLTGISFWTNNIHSVWYCSFITVLYAIYPLFFYIQRKKYSIWPTMLIILVINFSLFLLNPNYYRTIEVALTRIPIFFLGSYYAEQIMKKQSLKYLYWYSVIGFILYIISFVIRLEPDLETLCRRYFAGGFVIIIMCFFIYMFSKISINHPIMDFFGGISLEVYLISVLLRNIITRIELGKDSSILIKWIIVVLACATIILVSKVFNAFYFKAVKRWNPVHKE